MAFVRDRRLAISKIPLSRTARNVQHQRHRICSPTRDVGSALRIGRVGESRSFSKTNLAVKRDQEVRTSDSRALVPTFSPSYTPMTPPSHSSLLASATPFTPSVQATRLHAPGQKDFDALVYQLRTASLVADETLHPLPTPTANTIDSGSSISGGRGSSQPIVKQATQSPSAAYLAATAARSVKTARVAGTNQQQPHKPQLVVLDLNGTLCVRPKKTAKGANKAIPRPYVSTFLEYLLGAEPLSNGIMQSRFAVMVRLLPFCYICGIY